MKIKIEQSGGFAGICSSNEMDSNKLPASIEGTVRDLLDKGKSLATRDAGRRKGASDYLNYKIIIRDGKEDHVIEFNEPDMESSVKSLVRYIQKNSEKVGK